MNRREKGSLIQFIQKGGVEMSEFFELAHEFKRLSATSSKFNELYPALAEVIRDSDLVIRSCTKGSTRGCGLGCLGS